LPYDAGWSSPIFGHVQILSLNPAQQGQAGLPQGNIVCATLTVSPFGGVKIVG
jgi:hypothetical protein